jgi:BirA family biotin operon repressor/biotin-[acetyl-CoA-carboxylase] ligase
MFGTTRLPAIRRVFEIETTSTFEMCREILANGAAADEIIAATAGKQIGGRGSGGRTWESPTGNVYLTLAMPKALVAPAVLPVYPLMVASAVTRTVRQLCAGPDGEPRGVVQAKWPNDVLIDKAKVSGCLIEDGGSHLLIGVGLNVAEAPLPADGGRRACCVNDFAEPPTTAEAAALLLCNELVAATVAATDRVAAVEAYRRVMAWDVDMYTRLPNGQRGAKVRPVKLSEWGALTVEDVETKERRELLSEYLI